MTKAALIRLASDILYGTLLEARSINSDCHDMRKVEPRRNRRYTLHRDIQKAVNKSATFG